jgi:AcrR family transcriptional regulator
MKCTVYGRPPLFKEGEPMNGFCGTEKCDILATTAFTEYEPMNGLCGTMELIFDTFLEMASTLGYENVGVRAIAKKVGIHPSTIYHYFASKKDILEYVYEYYSKHLYNNRKSIAMMNNLMETADAEEIVTSFAYAFFRRDQKKHLRIALITKIIYMRMFQDPLAKILFMDNYKNNVEFITSVLKYGVEIGRIDPCFDTEAFAYTLIGSIEIRNITASTEAVCTVDQLQPEKRILALLAQALAAGLK